MQEQICNDLSTIITQALADLKLELGTKFDIEKVNLAELERRSKRCNASKISTKWNNNRRRK